VWFKTIMVKFPWNRNALKTIADACPAAPDVSLSNVAAG